MRISFSNSQLMNSKFQHHIEINFFVNKIHPLVQANKLISWKGKSFGESITKAGESYIQGCFSSQWNLSGRYSWEEYRPKEMKESGILVIVSTPSCRVAIKMDARQRGGGDSDILVFEEFPRADNIID